MTKELRRAADKRLRGWCDWDSDQLGIQSVGQYRLNRAVGDFVTAQGTRTCCLQAGIANPGGQTQDTPHRPQAVNNRIGEERLDHLRGGWTNLGRTNATRFFP